MLMVKYNSSLFTRKNLMVTKWCSWWNMAHPTSPWEISWSSRDPLGEMWLIHLHTEKSHGHHVMLMVKHDSSHLTMRNLMVVMWFSWWNMTPPSSPWEISWSPCDAHDETWPIPPHQEKSHGRHMMLMVNCGSSIFTMKNLMVTTWCSWWNMAPAISPWEITWSSCDAHGEIWLLPLHHQKSHGHHVVLMVKHGSSYLTMRNLIVISWCSW